MPISPYSAFSWNALLVAFGYAMPLIIAPLMATVVSSPLAQARPRADNSLGSESSIVRPQGNGTFNIEGGAVRDNGLLFHSFETFTIRPEQAVQFSKPEGPSIDTIITRVIGRRRSLIDGRLTVEGDSDFFFLNPNGIVFGPGAELRVGGSFIATTADSIALGDSFSFQADTPNVVPPLLSVNTPTGLQLGNAPGAIKNRSQFLDQNFGRGLFLTSGQTLGLIGGEIVLEASSDIQVTKGRIEVAAVGPNQTILLDPHPQGWAFNFDTVERFQNITAERASILSSFPTPELFGPSSAITLRGRNIRLADQEGSSNEIGGTNFRDVGGDLTLVATESIELENMFLIQLATAGTGGNIIISAPSLLLNQAVITTRSSIGSIGGDITIDADVVLVEGSIVDPRNEGDLDQPSRISTEAAAGSQAGNLILNADILTLQNGGQLDSGLIDGQSGENTGSSGNINVNARFISLDDSAQITAATTGGRGNITLNTDFLILNDDSSIIARGTGDASAGDIIINTDLIAALNASIIDTTAQGGDGGLVQITADSLFFSPDSDIDVSSQSGSDGTIDIRTPDSDPIEDTTEETEQPVDISRLVSTDTCTTRGRGSSFYMIGKGGIRESPLGSLVPNLMWEDWETATAMMHLFDELDSDGLEHLPESAAPSYVATNIASQELPQPNDSMAYSRTVTAPTIPQGAAPPTPNAPIRETQGWLQQDDGTIVLLSQPGTVTAQGMFLHPHDCQLLRQGLQAERF